MSKGGFGNLIALPLQNIPRKSGNSLFLDQDFRPHKDQWLFLFTLRKVQAGEAEAIVSNLIYIDKNGLPPAMINRLMRIASFQNPEFYKAQAMRLPTFRKPRVIACAEDYPRYIGLPRGV